MSISGHRARWILTGRGLDADATLWVEAGRVVAAPPPETAARIEDHGDAAILPGLVNSHSHGFQVLLRGQAVEPRDFADWVDRLLYPTARSLAGARWTAAYRLAFWEMARRGITSVGEFHYLHHPPQGIELDLAVVGAARAVGLRTVLLRALYDTAARPGQERFAETVDQARSNTLALAEALASDPQASVGVAPHSLHGASPEMLRMAAELARERGWPCHIHLAEQARDLDFCRGRYGQTPLAAIASLGLLETRLSVVHGIHLSADERRALGERRAGLVANPQTNAELGDGTADIPDLMARGVIVSVGTDANTRPCILHELAALEQAQRLRSLAMGRLTGQGLEPLFRLGTANGARNLGINAGALDVGRAADFIVLDLAEPSLWPAAQGDGRGLLKNLIFGACAPLAVRHSFVAGEAIVRDRRPARFDLGDVHAGLA